jgi:hypothetical protein
MLARVEKRLKEGWSAISLGGERGVLQAPLHSLSSSCPSDRSREGNDDIFDARKTHLCVMDGQEWILSCTWDLDEG